MLVNPTGCGCEMSQTFLNSYELAGGPSSYCILCVVTAICQSMRALLSRLELLCHAVLPARRCSC
jgi:hypothetical protein